MVALGVVVDQQGQGGGVQRVRHGQVEHVRGGGVPGLEAAQEDVERRGVEAQPEHAHRSIGHGQQHILEALVEAALVVQLIPIPGAVGSAIPGVQACGHGPEGKQGWGWGVGWECREQPSGSWMAGGPSRET